MRVLSLPDIIASGLFDEEWYSSQNLSPASYKINPIEHYLGVGFRLGHAPSPLFSVEHYSRFYPELDFRRTNPLLHYLQTPVDQRTSPHPLFDRDFYCAGGPVDGDALGHFLREGDVNGRSPHMLFDPSAYRCGNPDVARDGTPPFRHFLIWGHAEGRNPHPLFASSWYLQQHPEVRDWPSALQHYVEAGAAQGYWPHPLFDPEWYLSQTADPNAYDNPLIHYLSVGSTKGLSPHPLFDPTWYRRTQFLDDAEVTTEPLTHFLLKGSAAGLDPNPLFSTRWYSKRYPDVTGGHLPPIVHYLLHGALEERDPHPTFSTREYLNRHPECALRKANPLVDALKRQRLTSGRSVSVTPKGVERVSPSLTFVASPPNLANSGDRSYLAEILRDQASDACAARILSYFSIIENLDFSGSTSTLSRREKIALLTKLLKEASANFVRQDPPEVTVIVPSFNNVAYTIACVLSLLEHKTRRTYEILIGNNVSMDETRAVFEEVGGIVKCITHEKNEGFIRNCNLSALHVKGKYLVLLNNDTLIIDGWLDELIAPFEHFDNIGLTGSKLLMSDGKLQEAGGIVWDDASAWNFGRNADPRDSEFNYLKDVDYISGASIALPLAVWDEVGGMDERYVPAYFDDSDLAFMVRALGYRTIYQPTSVLIHHEGITHGTETTSGIKAYQAINKQKFKSKWAHALVADQFPNGQDVFVARDRSSRKPHILVIDHYVPQFDRDAGSRTMYDYVSLFARSGFQVTFWPENLFYDARYVRALQAMGVEVIYGPRFVGMFSPWMAENAKYLNYVLLSRAHIADQFIDTVKLHDHLKVLFYGHDIAFLRLKMQMEIKSTPELSAETARVETLERKIWSLSDVVYHPANFETEFVARECPGVKSRLFPPYLFDTSTFADARALASAEKLMSRPAAIFVAGFKHGPNADAAVLLGRTIWPMVLRKIPNAILYIAGSYPPPEVEALACDHITVTGYVSDPVLQTFYKLAHVAVAPLRFGGGIKFKVVEAMRYGLPVVTTQVGAQGLMDPDRYLRIASDPETLAQHIVELLQNPSRARKQALAAINYLQKQFSIESARTSLAQDIPELQEVNVAGASRLIQHSNLSLTYVKRHDA